MEPSLDSLKAEARKKLQRRLKTAKRSFANLQAQLEQAHKWHHLEREGLVLQANLYRLKQGMEHALLQDWENGKEMTLHLDKRIPLHDQVRARVRKSKKLHAAIPHLEKQLQRTQEHLSALGALLEQVEASSSSEELALLIAPYQTTPKRSLKSQVEKKRLPYKEYLSTKGMAIWVGQGAKDNDALTFKHANGSDWWLHVNEYPGSHVVIKVGKNQEPDPMTLEEAMQLAIGNSKAPKRGKVEVCVTQVKFLKKHKGSPPGMVHLSKHKNLLASFDKSRYDAILRLLP